MFIPMLDFSQFRFVLADSASLVFGRAGLSCPRSDCLI
jgi:hypothetical protein